jgi:hypothetical protein
VWIVFASRIRQECHQGACAVDVRMPAAANRTVVQCAMSRQLTLACKAPTGHARSGGTSAQLPKAEGSWMAP